jgi:hypothetical protein
MAALRHAKIVRDTRGKTRGMARKQRRKKAQNMQWLRTLFGTDDLPAPIEAPVLMEALRASLLDSLALCHPHIETEPALPDLHEALRTPALLPAARRVVEALESAAPKAAPAWSEAWEAFAACKQRLARERGIDAPALAALMPPAPQFLFVRIGRCLTDGIIPMRTRDYFSAHDAIHPCEELPPCDTWLGIAEDGRGAGLICWVPSWAGDYATIATQSDYVDMYMSGLP